MTGWGRWCGIWFTAPAFRSPGPQVIADYHRAVVEMIDNYLVTAPAGDPDRLANSPTLGDTVTVHQRLRQQSLSCFPC